MNPETAFFLLKVAGGIISVMIAALSFFLVMQINNLERVREIVITLKTVTDEQRNQCNMKHNLIDNRISELYKTGQNHEIRLNTIETKLNID